MIARIHIAFECIVIHRSRNLNVLGWTVYRVNRVPIVAHHGHRINELVQTVRQGHLMRTIEVAQKESLRRSSKSHTGTWNDLAHRIVGPLYEYRLDGRGNRCRASTLSDRVNASRDGLPVDERSHAIVDQHNVGVVSSPLIQMPQAQENRLLPGLAPRNDIDGRLIMPSIEHLVQIGNPPLKAHDNHVRNLWMFCKVGDGVIDDGSPAELQELLGTSAATHAPPDTTCKDQRVNAHRGDTIPSLTLRFSTSHSSSIRDLWCTMVCMAKSVAKNALYSGLRTMSTVLFPLITYPYASRVLLADNLGKVDFSVSFISFFLLIAGLGVVNYATREGARVREDHEALDRFSSEVFTINLCSTLASYLLLALLVAFWPHLHGYLSLLAIQSLTIIGTTLGVEWLYALSEDFGYITARTLVVQIISAVLLFALVKQQSDYVIYAAIIVLSNVGANVFNFIRARRYARIRLVWGFDVKRHLIPMLVLFGNTIATSIYINLDVTLLNVLRGDYDVGIYGLAVKLYTGVKQMLNALVMVSLPRLSLYRASNRQTEYVGLINSIVHGLVIVVLPCILLLYLLAEPAVLLFGGPAFANSADSLRMLCVALAPAVLAAFMVNSVLLPNLQERFVLISTTLGAAINLGLNLLVIPAYGAVGAAAATAVAEFAVLGSATFFARTHIDLRILVRSQTRTCVTTAIGMGAIAAICMPLHSTLGNSLVGFLASGATSLVAYAFVLLIGRDPLVLRVLKIKRPDRQ